VQAYLKDLCRYERLSLQKEACYLDDAFMSVYRQLEWSVLATSCAHEWAVYRRQKTSGLLSWLLSL